MRFTIYQESRIGKRQSNQDRIAYCYSRVGTFLRKYYLGNEESPKTIHAKITENIHAGEGRTTYQLVNLSRGEEMEGHSERGWLAQPIRAKSGAIAQLARAHGYVAIPQGSEGVRAGETVEVILIE